MKKGLLIFGLVFLLLINIVSAGWFDDWWGKITGKTVLANCDDSVDDDGDGDIDCDDESCAYSVACVLCYDSDGE